MQGLANERDKEGCWGKDGAMDRGGGSLSRELQKDENPF